MEKKIKLKNINTKHWTFKLRRCRGEENKVKRRSRKEVDKKGEIYTKINTKNNLYAQQWLFKSRRK